MADQADSRTLSGRTILVTGGAVRVGAAISKAVVKSGGRLAIHCHHHRSQACELAESLRAKGARVAVVEADLLRLDSIPPLFDQVESALGKVDGLVNNAGLIAETPFERYDSEIARQLFLLNTFAPMQTMAEMARRGPQRGAIVNVTDSSAERAWLGHAAYCASKTALLSATRIAARELAPSIRVNAVSPGTVELREEERDRAGALRKVIPLERIGDPTDVAQAVVFLLQAEYITGAVLNVDGGRALLA